MNAILASAFLLLGGGLAVFVVWRYLTRRAELATPLHVFIAGMIFFQIINSAPVMRQPDTREFKVVYVAQSGMIWLGSIVVFLIAFAAVYKYFPVNKLASVIRVPRAAPNAAILLAMLPVLVVAAFLLRQVAVPYVGVLTSIVGLSLTSVAAGVATWVWMRNLFNPVVMAIALPTMAACAVIASVGEFSRRPILSVMIAIAWGAYYSRFRFIHPVVAAPRIAAVGLAGILVIGAFTIGGRSIEGVAKLATPQGAVEAFESVVVSDYDTARYAIWLIDQNYFFDRDFKVEPLLSVWYTFAQPIPRGVIWADKPYPVSTFVSDWADREGVKLGRGGVTSPAGIVGNAPAEGGIYPIFVYAMFWGLLVKLSDLLCERVKSQPLAILAMGSVMGQMFGIPRGETPILTFNYLFGTVTTFIILAQLSRLVVRIFPQWAGEEQAVSDAVPVENPHVLPDPFESGEGGPERERSGYGMLAGSERAESGTAQRVNGSGHANWGEGLLSEPEPPAKPEAPQGDIGAEVQAGMNGDRRNFGES